MLLTRHTSPTLIAGLVLADAQRFSGINTIIIYYAPTIIEQTGLTASNAILVLHRRPPPRPVAAHLPPPCRRDPHLLDAGSRFLAGLRARELDLFK